MMSDDVIQGIRLSSPLSLNNIFAIKSKIHLLDLIT